MRFMAQDSEEMRAVWALIGREDGDTAQECPSSGETWQYMGTETKAHGELRPGEHSYWGWTDASKAGEWHCFRHRSHPKHRGARVYWWIQAADLGAIVTNVRAYATAA